MATSKLLFIATAAFATPLVFAQASAPVAADSGLIYKSLKEGSGPSPAATDVVKVHDRGTVGDGTGSERSRKRGQPAE